MEMPERCAECGFCIHQRTNGYGSYGDCILQNHNRVDCLVWYRDNGCPLGDVKQTHTDTDGNIETEKIMENEKGKEYEKTMTLNEKENVIGTLEKIVDEIIDNSFCSDIFNDKTDIEIIKLDTVLDIIKRNLGVNK